ncbi:MAG: sulfatase-like hydrolase/transferase, partial [Planktomarina sp.]|nr:sulfatase-like hydrolase/transferase [Planktomarina sp.]
MRILLLGGTTIYVLASWALASSLYMQGVGFNEQFFFHLDVNTFRVALEQYGLLYYGALLIGLLTIFMPLIIRVSGPVVGNWHRIPVLLLILGFSPMHSMAIFIADQNTQAYAPSVVLVESPVVDVQTLNRAPRNLIFLYLESLEQLYFDEQLYPGLVPHLKRLRQRAHSYTNLNQVRGTGFTMGGIVASQCGVPLNSRHGMGSVNTTLGSVKNPLPDYTCLGDILKAYGYNTVMYKGASLSFSGARNFFNSHGFKNAKGGEYWKQKLDGVASTGWGIYDDTLFQQALSKVETLQRTEEPFAFSLVTLDTHHPDGHASASCPAYIHSSDTMLNAIHCTDYLVGKWVADLTREGLLDNTVLVVFSDHLAMRNTQWDVLMANKEQRKLSFIVLAEDEDAKIFKQPATHFDVAPTVLDYLGIPGYPSLNAGVSLRHGAMGAWFQPGSDAREIAQAADFAGRALSVKGGIFLDYTRQSIVVDGIEFIANNDGEALKVGFIYGVIFDQTGKYEGVVSSRELDYFFQHSDKLMILLSRSSVIKGLIKPPLAAGFIDSSEFKSLADTDNSGVISNQEFILHMYNGVFGRD